MPTVTTRTAPAAGWDAVQRTMTGGGDGGSCWCQWFRLTSAEFSAASIEDKREALHAEIDAGTTHGVVAYVDGEPAGWCRAAPRPAQPRLGRSQIGKASTRLPLTDPDVWAITCLIVRKEFRGMGVTRALVAAAVDLARASGAAVVEAYPRDPAAGRSNPNEAYVGIRAMFDSAGFRVTAQPKPGRVVMTKDLR